MLAHCEPTRNLPSGLPARVVIEPGASRKFAALMAIAGASLLLAGLAPANASAAGYPERAIRMLVPSPAGASSDLSARQLSQKYAEFLGQQIYIENRPSASGILCAEAAAKAAPDGYTLMFATAQTHSINKGLFEKLPYDPVSDFTAIGRVSTLKLILVVPPDLPVKTPLELAAYIKANPGKVNYASSGNGTTAHLAGVYFAKIVGAPMTHVPYNSIAQSIADLSTGRVSLMFYVHAPMRGAIQAGKLKLLASTGDTRAPGLPDTPTMVESGFPGFVVTTWSGIYAPARTPRPIVDTLNAALAKTLKDPQVLKSMEAGGYTPDPTTPEQFAEFTRAEAGRYVEILRNSGVTVD